MKHFAIGCASWATSKARTSSSNGDSRALDLIAKLKLPAIYSNDSFVPLGGLMSYAADQAHQYGEAAVYVAKILVGAKPADLPVQQPTKFELAINLKTAKALGVTFPQTILVRADRVVE